MYCEGVGVHGGEDPLCTHSVTSSSFISFSSLWKVTLSGQREGVREEPEGGREGGGRERE